MGIAGLAHGYGSGRGAALPCQCPLQAKNSKFEQLLTCVVYENIKTAASTQEMLSTVTHRLQSPTQGAEAQACPGWSWMRPRCPSRHLVPSACPLLSGTSRHLQMQSCSTSLTPAHQ